MYDSFDYILEILEKSNIFYIGKVDGHDICVICQEPDTDWDDYNIYKNQRHIFIGREATFNKAYEAFLKSVS
ncbi:MAG: hypothetical protein AB1454_08815 [Candidatus Auribacterota bacterium]